MKWQCGANMEEKRVLARRQGCSVLQLCRTRKACKGVRRTTLFACMNSASETPSAARPSFT